MFPYGSTAWKRLRNAIIARDGYQCQLCKRQGRITEGTIVHHKKPADEYPEIAWEPSNLITVCKTCHNMIHGEGDSRKGYYNNWKQGGGYDAPGV